jgi:hypothetical protein
MKLSGSEDDVLSSLLDKVLCARVRLIEDLQSANKLGHIT